MKAVCTPIAILFSLIAFSQQALPTFEQYIKENIPSKKEIDAFLNDQTWAKFSPETGYVLGQYIPHDGMDESFTISTSQENGARTAYMYAGKPCRINTYGNSFTQCHQVSDGETWQEYLAAHIGEPIRNFGMGGFGVYQSYQRMLKEEKTKNNAANIIFYIWGDDHIRSLLRCRYMVIKSWVKEHEEGEGAGKMFHGNFWPNVEMDFATGALTEKTNLIANPKDLYLMTDAEWMYKNLKDDFAMQMFLYKKNKIKDINLKKIKQLAGFLNYPLKADTIKNLKYVVGKLLDKYAFASTQFILQKVKDYTLKNNKKLLVVIFDPYDVTKSLINSGTRYDSEIVEFLQKNNFTYFDMNLEHVNDFKNFNIPLEKYFKRYFIGHYNPAGNHFFAYSIKPKVVEWLSPKPITYKSSSQKLIDFNGYLEGLK